MSNINKLTDFLSGGKPAGSKRELPGDPGNNSREVGETYSGPLPDQTYPSYTDQGSYQQHRSAPPESQQQEDSGFNVLPPAGYEMYHNPSPSNGGVGGAEWPEYKPPEQGAHTYDYYQGQYGGPSPAAGGYGRP
jgi:hypothetical protein